MNPLLVSCDWLADHLQDPGISVVDGSWYLPNLGRDPRSEFEAEHIPGAVFFDLDAVVDPGSKLPHTMPSADIFSAAVGRLGIAETDSIIVYDGLGLFSAARVRWMFRAFGAENVFILDGGFPAWKAGGYPTEQGRIEATEKTFHVEADAVPILDFEEMSTLVAAGDQTILDARPAGRFTGEVPEPRPGMRSGHMPGAKSLPIDQLVENGHLLPLKVLRERFARLGVDPNTPIATTCGSGVTAAIISLALESLGGQDHKLYDGSWSEWGGRDDTPIETG